MPRTIHLDAFVPFEPGTWTCATRFVKIASGIATGGEIKDDLSWCGRSRRAARLPPFPDSTRLLHRCRLRPHRHLALSNSKPPLLARLLVFEGRVAPRMFRRVAESPSNYSDSRFMQAKPVGNLVSRSPPSWVKTVTTKLPSANPAFGLLPRQPTPIQGYSRSNRRRAGRPTCARRTP